MTISADASGSFDQTEAWLRRVGNTDIFNQLSHYGAQGVAALSAATPQDSGETASSWYYEILQDRTSWAIVWGNSNMAAETPVAILLQYGHGTGTGGYVEGQDYINPAMKPIFDQMISEGWKVAISG